MTTASVPSALESNWRSRAVSTSARPHTRLRLTPRGRVVLTALASLPVAAIVLVAVLGAGGAAAAPSATVEQSTAVGVTHDGFEYVIVSNGDTLWELAERIAPASDPRVVIDAIVRLNRLDDSTVQPGQRLALPLQL